MSVQKFAGGMLFVAVVVGIWSLLDAAPWSTVLLRVVACAVILQVGYFLVVLGMVIAEPGNRARKNDKSAEAAGDVPAKAGEAQNLSRSIPPG